MSRMIYCFDCEEAKPPDDDGFCEQCESDNVFSYDSEDVDRALCLICGNPATRNCLDHEAH